MRKISIITVLSLIVMPGFAREYGTLDYPEPLPGEFIKTVEYGKYGTDAENMLMTNTDENATVAKENIKNTDEQINSVNDTMSEEPLKNGSEDNADNSKSKEIAQNESVGKTQYESEKSSNPHTAFPHGLQFGIGVSPTSGLNGFIGYNNKKFDSFWAKRFGIRFDIATFSPIKNKLNRKINSAISDKGIKLDDGLKIAELDLNGKHYGAIVDFYPFGDTWFLGGWRISGGYMTGNLDLNADIFGTSEDGKIKFELGDGRFYYDGYEMQGGAKLKWKYRGPYLGTGFDLGLFWGLKIYMDAGVVFSDQTAKLGLDVPLKGLKHQSDGTVVTQSELDTAKAQALYDAQKELDKYPYYPLVKIGFMYRF